ncbi:MAG: PQQ-binding-like beta-propeller repeat protein [Actinomycetota bacterium]|nr:PQQ-binding-like beta-propeller repeat protein [Actinomycetota bacterium]
MRTLLRLFGVGVLAVMLSGCWLAPGAGPDRQSFNPFERTLTTDTVAGLREGFRVPLVDGAGPPVVNGVGVFVRSGVTIQSFTPDSGTLRWSTTLPDPSEYESTISDPFIQADGKHIVASQRSVNYTNHLETLDADTGAAQRRDYSGIAQSLRGTRLGSAYQPDPGEQPTLTFVGVRNLDDATTWGGYALEASGPAVATLGESLLYVVNGNKVLAYNPSNPCLPYPGFPALLCNSEWVRPYTSATTAVVIGSNATVFTATASGDVYALNAATGGERWRASLGSAVNQTLALANGTLYVGSSDGRLSAIAAGGCGLALCPVLWSTATGSAITSQPAVAGGVVYTGAADGSVKAFKAAGCGAATCPSIWSANAGSSVDGGLAIEGAHLYAGAHSALLGYRLSSG